MRDSAAKTKQGVPLWWGGLLVMALCALPVVATARNWPVAVGEGSISRWNDDKISAYSLTIDDNHSQDIPYWQSLANLYDMDWTWFLITDNVGSGNGGTWAEWQTLVNQGHSVGSHSVTHLTGGNPIAEEYEDSQIALQNNLTGNDPLVFAYPNGSANSGNDPLVAANYYIACRGVVGTINQNKGAATIDYNDTKSVSSAQNFNNPATPWAYFPSTLDPASNNYGGWYSCHFHSVSSWETSVTNMLDILQANEADVWVGTFQQVGQYGQEFENATLNVTSVSGTEIHFTVTDTLDDTLFDFPLTVKVRVDSAWGSVVASQNGSAVLVELVENGGKTYALVQAVPDQGEVVLQEAGSAEGLLVVIRGVSKNRVWVDADFAGPVFTGDYDAPFQTVQAGLNAAAPGEIVTVREGTYREQLTLPSGAPGLPITLSAATGERVVLNAMVPVTDWQAMTAGRYSKVVTWDPSTLYSGFKKMVQAREPNEGWWQADSVSENVSSNTFTLMDATNLIGLPHDLTGASVYIWTQGTDRFYTCPIVSFDSVSGSVEFENVNPAMAPAAGDKYWLENQVSLLDLPNEWASVPEAGDFRIYYDPADTDDLAGTQIPPASGRVIFGQNVAHIRLNDLEVAGGIDRGIYLLDVQDVEINRCIVHDNELYGIWMRRATDCSVRNTISMANRFGAVFEEATNIVVEANEFGANNEDGLVFARNSSNIVVRSNYLHNHLLWGHPDNSQTYLGVADIHYIENLIVAGGQSVMLEQTTDAEFAGNMVIGSGANMLSFGHGTLTNVTIQGNTLACSGYANLGLTGETTYDVKENVFMTGHGTQMYTVTDAMDYQGDRNLFWNGDRLVDPILLVSDGAWGGGPSEPFSVVYENNDVAGSDLTANVEATHADLSVSVLGQQIGSAAGWTNALTGIQNSAGINSLATAISADDYFTFTVTPVAAAVIGYSNLFVRVSLGANTQPAKTTFTFMSSLTGFTAADGLAAFTNETLSASTMGIQNSLDLSGMAALQDVAAGTVVEFRLYAHNTGANPMTRIGIGEGFVGGTVDDDLRLSGTVSSGSGSGGTPETIYHTSLATFQSTVGQDLNSVSGDPLFVNAPFGINVMDSALLHQATRTTFSLRDANEFLIGDHVEVNFDGVVRTVTASSGAVVTIDPPLTAKPLKGYLLANWGTNTNFALDLELLPGSPGIGLGQGGGIVGSPILIQQYQNGDFDGDGRRDLPEIPADLIE